MNNELRKKGFTLIELLVVIVIIATLVAVAIPSARAIRSSYESTGAEAMISSAFSSARAMAAKHQRYTGVRFQKAYVDPNDEPDPVKRLFPPQYMIFVAYDPNIRNGTQGNLGCRAVEGVKPVKLPDNIGVIEVVPNDSNYVDVELRNRTTFSILFSPTGKLIIHSLWVRNKDGFGNNTGTAANEDYSTDDIFNSINNVCNNGVGMFIQDPKADIELSEKEFIVYDKAKFKAVNINRRWTDYLSKLPVRYINQYTGTMIEK